jgi:hypothetical protein
MTRRQLTLILCAALGGFGCGPRHVDTVVRPTSMDDVVSCAIHVAERHKFQEWTRGHVVHPGAVKLYLVPSSGRGNIHPIVIVTARQIDDSLAVDAVIEEGLNEGPLEHKNTLQLARDINSICVPSRPDSAAN